MAEAERAALAGLDRFGMRFGLERIRALLTRLGDPHADLDAVHVVGTNGKTSTVRFTAAAISSAGLHVGSYISPHVLGWEERIQLDGQPLAPARLDELLRRVLDVAGAVDVELGDAPTQFEVLTAAALCAFADEGVDACVLEAGLGGRYDATNAIDARVVGLTGVGLDHTAILGDTLEAIMSEKLAVLSLGAELCLGPLDRHLEAEARRLATAAGASTIYLVDAVAVAAEGATVRARYQRANVALALLLAERFLAPRPLDRAAARARIDGAVPPGRLEIDPGPPLVVRDGAHNIDGMTALAAELPAVLGERRPRIAVCAIQADKAVEGMLVRLAAHCDALLLTDSGHSGSLSAAELHDRAAALGLTSEAIADPVEALGEARRRAGGAGAVVVCGSLYLLERLAVDDSASSRVAVSRGSR